MTLRNQNCAMIAVAIKNKFLLLVVCALAVGLTVSSCTQAASTGGRSSRNAVSIVYDIAEDDIGLATTEISYITLKGNTIVFEGREAVVDGSRIAITTSGIYVISGKLYNGQVIVKSEAKDTVYLILNGADITCSDSAPIYIDKASSTVIILADGTENTVTDGESYRFVDSTSDEPNAAVFSKDDLTIKGKGSLTVNANYNNGIQSKDDLDILGGGITVNARNDAIKGRDSVIIKGGNLKLKSGGDGLQSTNAEEQEKGIIVLTGGEICITSSGDGIQAETQLLIQGGNIRISSGGGSTVSIPSNSVWHQRYGRTMPAADTDTGSSKGLKANTDITITEGTISIDASDDAIHSNGTLTIEGGKMTLSTGDDGVRAADEIIINGGEIDVVKCYEGMESENITINSGKLYIVSIDDGINVGAGEAMGGPMGGLPGWNMQGQAMLQWGSDNRTRGPISPKTGDAFPMVPPSPARPGQNMQSPPMPKKPGLDMQGGDNSVAVSNSNLYIKGGYLVIDAAGDGLDVNGSIVMTGGTVLINGPTANDNGALDYYGTFQVNGGFLAAAGSAGMAQSPSTSSTQYSVIVRLQSTQQHNPH